MTDVDMDKQMTTDAPAARLKGVGDSLWVTINPALPPQQLKEALSGIFGRMDLPPGNARVVLDPGEDGGHDALVRDLGGFLKETFHLELVPAAGKTKPKPPERVRARELRSSWRYRRSNVLMIAGRVRSGQKVEAGKHLMLLGDVNPGGEVTAGGDIFIMGSLRGTASAGSPGDATAIILALDFRPSQIQIGGYVAAGSPGDRGNGAEFARVEEGAIVVADYLKENPFGKIPWPEIR